MPNSITDKGIIAFYVLGCACSALAVKDKTANQEESAAT